MSDNGYFSVHRQLTRCSAYLNAPINQRIVLLTILDYACFSPCQQDDHGVAIDLLPGEFMTTYRDLADLARLPKKTGKNDVQNALKRFFEAKILRHKVRHVKTVITILWGLELKDTYTRGYHRVRQELDLKEQDNKTTSDDLIDSRGARIEEMEGNEMDKLVIVRNRSRSGIVAMRESQILAELEPLGFSREKIREAIASMVEQNPILSNNAKITNYLKSIINNNKPREKSNGNKPKERPCQQDSLRRTRENITKSSIRKPCQP